MRDYVMRSVRLDITLRPWVQWELFLNVVVACRPSVCPFSRNRTHGNPPKEMLGCVRVSEQDHLGLCEQDVLEWTGQWFG